MLSVLLRVMPYLLVMNCNQAHALRLCYDRLGVVYRLISAHINNYAVLTVKTVTLASIYSIEVFPKSTFVAIGWKWVYRCIRLKSKVYG